MLSTKQSNVLIALVDCNNFFVSCERAFNPSLANKPVVVLSRNDGCVIARSNEVKAMGVPMGAPFFKYKELLQSNKTIIFSSNFALYGDMSARIMALITPYAVEREVYSIDEAFLTVDWLDKQESAKDLRKRILQCTGIPVSIGMAPTKTLAKVANVFAKKKTIEGVFLLNERSMQEEILRSLSPEEIWGIGNQTHAFLWRKGIRTAWDLAQADENWVKQHLSITGLRTVLELRGIACFPIDEAPSSKKSIIYSRAFSKEVYNEDEIAKALSSYVSRAAEKMRAEGSIASFLEIFLHTNRFKSGYYRNSIHITLGEATDFTPILITTAKKALASLYHPNQGYKKVGVMLGGLLPKEARQPDLFIKNHISTEKQASLMEVLDEMHEKYGKRVIRFAAESISSSARCAYTSPHYTTDWKEILSINLH